MSAIFFLRVINAGVVDNYVTNPDVISPDGCRYNIWDKDLAYGNIRQMNQFLVMQKKYSTFPDDKKENGKLPK